MFVAVEFGRRLRKYFTIDGLATPLSDCIFTDCIIEMIRILKLKENQFQKEIIEIMKKNPIVKEKIEVLDIKIKQNHSISDNKLSYQLSKSKN